MAIVTFAPDFTCMSSSAEVFIKRWGSSPSVVASAPGRVEIIGNHTDYNGGTVVGAGISQRLEVACSLRTDGVIRIASDNVVETSAETYQESSLPEWTRYPLGVFDELRMLEIIKADVGFDLAVVSEIPQGEGLASSAAFELATAIALTALCRSLAQGSERSALVRIAHRAENRFVGVPCGLLDQTVVGFARAGFLVVLDASTGRHHLQAVPDNIRLVLFRTHIRHQLLDSPYEKRHDECRVALMGLQKVIPGIRYLAHLHPVDIVAYDVILNDTLARRARHIVEEQRRVGRFLKALTEGDTSAAGGLLFDSHESSKTQFENSTPEMDFLVQKLKEQRGVLGARLSGAGWGGTVLAMVDSSFEDESADQVAASYEEVFEARSPWWRSEVSDGARIERQD